MPWFDTIELLPITCIYICIYIYKNIKSVRCSRALQFSRKKTSKKSLRGDTWKRHIHPVEKLYSMSALETGRFNVNAALNSRKNFIQVSRVTRTSVESASKVDTVPLNRILFIPEFDGAMKSENRIAEVHLP